MHRMAFDSPNHIPAGVRGWNIFLSIILLSYGTFGVLVDDLYIPGRHTKGLHFHGEPAWIMYGAMICAVLNLLSVVVDHYDGRNNEVNYRRFAKVTQIAGWALFGTAFVLDAMIFRKITR